MWKINENDWTWSIGISPMITRLPRPFLLESLRRVWGIFVMTFCDVSKFHHLSRWSYPRINCYHCEDLRRWSWMQLKGMIGMSHCLTLNAHSAEALRARWIWCSLPFGASEAETFRNSSDVETLEDFGSGWQFGRNLWGSALFRQRAPWWSPSTRGTGLSMMEEWLGGDSERTKA